MDSKDLLSLLKEPLFFDDWAAANFKAINLPPDWLAAQQSPYQILGGDPGAVRQSAEIALSLGWPRLAEVGEGEKKSSGGQGNRAAFQLPLGDFMSRQWPSGLFSLRTR